MASFRSQFLVPAGVGFLAGLFALQLSSIESDANPHVLVPLIGGVVAISCRWWRALALAVGFVAGAVAFWSAATEVVDSRLNERFAGDSIMLDIEITNFPNDNNLTTSFAARPLSDDRFPDHLRLSWFEPPHHLALGQHWRLEVRLRRPRGLFNPGVFDLERWLFRERIGASGYVVDSPRNRFIGLGKPSLTARLRTRFAARVRDVVQNPDVAAVLAAVAVGVRHHITDEQWQRFNRTGTSHLVAISGLHIGLAAGSGYVLFMLLTGLLRCRGNRHRQALIAALGVGVAYATISGFAVPSQRACIMLLLASIAMLSRRPVRLLHTLCLTAVITALVDPLVSLSPGFVLSFGAVAVIGWLTARRATVGQRLPAMRLQALLLIGLLPLTAWVFSRVSVAALPINLLAIPLFSVLVVPVVLLALVFDGPLAAIGDILIAVAAQAVRLFDWVVTITAAQDWAAISIHGDIPVWLLFLPAIWILLPPGFPGRAVALLAGVAILIWPASRPDASCVNATVLDVGQGLAVLIETATHTTLYDTGLGFRNGGSSATATILPFLEKRGIRRLDRLIVSHGDNDHAGGAQDILRNIVVGDILAAEPIAGYATRACAAGQRWTFDGVFFELLHPTPEFRGPGNDGSCVLRISTGRRAFLLSGDIEQAAEHALVRAGVLLATDVVLVPHHGSKTSSSAPFVAAVDASDAIVSAGAGNRWGFPKPAVIERWQKHGARVLNTAESGAIEVSFCDDSETVEIVETRRVYRRIWHE